MEIGALRQEEFSVWVPFRDASVLIAYVGLDELREINASATKVSWHAVSAGSTKSGGFDPKEANRLLGRSAVKDWRGFTMQAEDFPYSAENCDFLMARWAEFAKFIGEAALDLQRLAEAQERGIEKNSVLTSVADGTTRG